MPSVSTDAVVSRLSDVGVRTRRTDPDGFAETVEEAVDPPAVGVELSRSGVSLGETSVTVDPTGAEIAAARTGVTAASLFVADYGTLVLPDDGSGAEQVSLFVDHHVAVLRASDVVPDMETAFERFGSDPREARRSRILATGPSATADMGELVVGAHGPGEVTAILLEE